MLLRLKSVWEIGFRRCLRFPLDSFYAIWSLPWPYSTVDPPLIVSNILKKVIGVVVLVNITSFSFFCFFFPAFVVMLFWKQIPVSVSSIFGWRIWGSRCFCFTWCLRWLQGKCKFCSWKRRRLRYIGFEFHENNFAYVKICL